DRGYFRSFRRKDDDVCRMKHLCGIGAVFADRFRVGFDVVRTDNGSKLIKQHEFIIACWNHPDARSASGWFLYLPAARLKNAGISRSWFTTFGVFKTGIATVGAGAVAVLLWRSKPVAITVIFTSSFMLSSSTAPKMMLASGSAPS